MCILPIIPTVDRTFLNTILLLHRSVQPADGCERLAVKFYKCKGQSAFATCRLNDTATGETLTPWGKH